MSTFASNSEADKAKADAMFANASKAVVQEQNELLSMFLTKSPSLLTQTGPLQKPTASNPHKTITLTLFQIACDKGNSTAAKMVLESMLTSTPAADVYNLISGYYVDHLDESKTALHMACRYDMLEIFELIVTLIASFSNDTTVEEVTKSYGYNGFTNDRTLIASLPPTSSSSLPVHGENYGLGFTDLRPSPPPPPTKPPPPTTPLHSFLSLLDSNLSSFTYTASASGSLKCLPYLLRLCKESVNWTQINNASPLHVASACTGPITCQMLIDHGSDVNAVDVDGYTPLFLASKVGNISVIPILINAGARNSLGASNGSEPLYVACQSGNIETVKTLLKCGAGVNGNGSGHTALHISVMQKNVEIVTFLIENGANVEAEGGDTRNRALNIASQKGDVNMVKYLVEKGAVVDAANGTGATAVMMAGWFGCFDVVELLVTVGKADLELKDHNGSGVDEYCREGFKYGLVDAKKCEKFVKKVREGKGKKGERSEEEKKLKKASKEEKKRRKLEEDELLNGLVSGIAVVKM